MTTTSTSSRKPNEFEVQILREIDGQLPASPRGVAAGGAYERLRGLGLIEPNIATRFRVTPAGRKWLDDHPLSPKADPAAKPDDDRTLGPAPRVQCPRCPGKTHCRVDERKADGNYGPGPLLRCVGCKHVFRDPTLPDASVTEASGDGAGAVAFDPTDTVVEAIAIGVANDALIRSMCWDKAKREHPHADQFGVDEIASGYLSDIHGTVQEHAINALRNTPATPSPDGDAETDAADGGTISVNIASYEMGLRDALLDPEKTKRSLEGHGPFLDEPGFQARRQAAREKMNEAANALARRGARTPEAAPSPAAGGSFQERDAARYRHLRSIGAAPNGTLHLKDGLVLVATNLDHFLDLALAGKPVAPAHAVEMNPASWPKIDLAPLAQGASFQNRVAPWLLECFGELIAGDREERNHRFLEEALELVQSLGCTVSEAHQLVDYVFGRPAGDPSQESGGVMVTLASLCLANGLDMHDAAEVELARIWTKVDKIRAKQAAKPKHSPLPEHVDLPPSSSPAEPAPPVTSDPVMTKTEQVISEREIRELLGYEPDAAVEGTIDTHDGQWQREATGWRFWLNEDTGPCP